MTDVQVVYRKYDGALHWHYPATHLGDDEHGRWLGAPAGTSLRRGDEPASPAEFAHVLLVPRTGWWTSCFNAAPHRLEIYCDITTIPHWTGEAEVSMVDLDLDVLRRRGGAVELVDEDEFATHQVRYGYPAEVIANAHASADWLVTAVRDRLEPFAGRHQHWLAQLVSGRR